MKAKLTPTQQLTLDGLDFALVQARKSGLLVRMEEGFGVPIEVIGDFTIAVTGVVSAAESNSTRQL